MPSRWEQVVVDAKDPSRLGRWWAEALGYMIVDEGKDADGEYLEIQRHPGEMPSLFFVHNEDVKRVKNRLHLDLRPDDQETEVERLVNMGARPIDIGQGQVPWVLLADPEGNEFCVLAARPAQPQ
jgi:hypothetical protein